MKRKTLALWLLLSMIICLTACMGEKKGEIGTTYTSNNGIEFTVNEIAFADVIDGWGGANDDFWKPIDENNCNVGGRFATVEDYKSAHGLTPKKENDRIIYISYTAENKSKYDRTIDETGDIDYDNGYKYSDGYLSYRVSEEGVWKELPSGLSLPKLDGGKYEFRAYTVVPKEVVESDKPLDITIHGYKFKIR
ncbi:MAG: hypothetical protein PUF08_06605 [Clostridiales bacterium]|nr:hypothetical protein [Clostridiales bacterium]